MYRRVRGWRTSRIRRLKYNFENRFTSCSFTTSDQLARGTLIPGDAIAGVRKMAFLRGTMSINTSSLPKNTTSNVNALSDDTTVIPRVIPSGTTWTGGRQVLVAIIYLPEGFDINAQQLNVTSPVPGSGGFTSVTSDCYVPSQNLLWSGIVDYFQPCKFRVPINKNLNANDSIVILAKCLSQSAESLTLNVQYTYSMAYR